MKYALPFIIIILSILAACRNEPVTIIPNVRATDIYADRHRPQFHFSPQTGWMNDPNGLVFYEGEYHLFYQHYPDSTVWGPMHWAHAVSRDLVKWENLPIALYPDSLGYIFSGSAVVDWKNTSGFGKNGQPPLVAMYTYHDMEAERAGSDTRESQAIAYSLDRGRTWVKYEGNPVIPNPGKVRDFRDPKLVWDEARSQWVTTLAVGQHAELWASPDFKTWKKLSEFGADLGNHEGVWECPDMFPIKVEGTGEQRWVILQNLNPGGPNGGSAVQYFVGDFDGKNFTVDPSFLPDVQGGKAVWLDHGKDNYAGVTWSDVPDGRRLTIGWMSNWQYAQQVPTLAWRSACTLPRVLTLRKTAVGYRLFSEPVKELEALRQQHKTLEPTTVHQLGANFELAPNLLDSISPAQMELVLDIEPSANARFSVELSNPKGEVYRIGYDAKANQFFSDRTKAGDHSFSPDFAKQPSVAPRISTDKTVRLHLFFDAASAELFADGGATVMTEVFFPSEGLRFNKLRLVAEGGEVKVLEGEAWGLGRIW